MKKTVLVQQLIVAIGFMSIFSPSAWAESGLKFGGVSFSAGSTVQANVPLNGQEKSFASKNGNAAPANAIAVLAVPANFDPRKSWPVFVVLSTSDFHHQDRGDLERYYLSTALAEGWVLLAGDGPGTTPPRRRILAHGHDSRRAGRVASKFPRIRKMADYVRRYFGGRA